MSLWTEIPGSPKFSEDGGGGARLTRIYETDYNQGATNAKANGIIRGKSIRWQGPSVKYFLTLENIEIFNTTSKDQVVAFYSTGGGMSVGPKRVPYVDGVWRQPGDEEWTIELQSGEVQAIDALDKEGQSWSGTWNIERTTRVMQPGATLVWRKWFIGNPGFIGTRRSNVPLPATKERALTILQSYLPGGAKNFEPKGPQLMYTLDSTAIGKKLLCVRLYLEADADLLVRVAHFKWRAAEWPSTIFGNTP